MNFPTLKSRHIAILNKPASESWRATYLIFSAKKRRHFRYVRELMLIP